MAAGIYQIRNKINNKIYIGSSKNLDKRYNQHLRRIKNKNHSNKHLQAAFDKYGYSSFIFEIIILCHPDLLLFYEQQFLDQWKPEYNISVTANSPMKGRHHSEEAKNKLRLHHVNRTYPELKKSWLNPHNKGKPMSEITKQKLSLKLKGRHHTVATRLVISQKLMGSERGAKMHIGLISPDGEEYKNIFNMAKFCREKNIDQRRISDIESGKILQYKGWTLLGGGHALASG